MWIVEFTTRMISILFELRKGRVNLINVALVGSTSDGSVSKFPIFVLPFYPESSTRSIHSSVCFITLASTRPLRSVRPKHCDTNSKLERSSQRLHWSLCLSSLSTILKVSFILSQRFWNQFVSGLAHIILCITQLIRNEIFHNADSKDGCNLYSVSKSVALSEILYTFSLARIFIKNSAASNERWTKRDHCQPDGYLCKTKNGLRY